ncbi:MAG TPA: hypothetical protein VGC61_02665, partial [Pyrinomonadaceae bacterium]
MKVNKRTALILAALLFLATSAVPVFPQGLQPAQPVNKETTSEVEKRPAKVLFEDARSYLDRKYAEFNKQKVPYDQKLEATTKQEQKDLAAKYAAAVQSRKSLAGDDYYYLGMLYHTAGNGDGALEAMRRYLGDEVSGTDAQLARAVVVLYTTR